MNNPFDNAFDILDEFFGQEVIYKTYIDSTGGDPALGQEEVDNYSSETLTSRVHEFTLEEINKSGGAYILGDIEFTVRKETVSYDDLISYQDSDYKPYDIKKIWIKGLIGYRIRCRKQ